MKIKLTKAQKQLAAKVRLKKQAAKALLPPEPKSKFHGKRPGPNQTEKQIANVIAVRKSTAKKRQLVNAEKKVLAAQMEKAQQDIDATKALEPLGAKSAYTQEIGDLICARLSTGKTLLAICQLDGMPALSTVYSWLSIFDKFKIQYDIAKLESADTLVEQALDIADNQVAEPLRDDEGVTVLDENGDPVMVKSQVGVAHANLRVKVRQWMAAKMKPKTYGDKVQTELTGANGGPIAVISVAMSAKEAADIYNQNINRNK